MLGTLTPVREGDLLERPKAEGVFKLSKGGSLRENVQQCLSFMFVSMCGLIPSKLVDLTLAFAEPRQEYKWRPPFIQEFTSSLQMVKSNMLCPHT